MTAGPVTLEIALRLGSVERVVALPELAAAVGLDASDLAHRLATLLSNPSRSPDGHGHTGGKRGTTGGDGQPTLHESNERTTIHDSPIDPIDDRQKNVRETFVRDGGSREEGRARAERTGEHSAERVAGYLAERLDDRRSLAFYTLVARTVPADVIRSALVAALDVAPSAIRRSRAAYFTAIVRPYLRGRESPTPYARTPPHSS